MNVRCGQQSQVPQHASLQPPDGRSGYGDSRDTNGIECKDAT